MITIISTHPIGIVSTLYQPTTISTYPIFNARFTSLDVKKNRYDGQVGNLFIEYRSPVHKFIEATDQNAAESEVRNHDSQVLSCPPLPLLVLSCAVPSVAAVSGRR